MYYNNFGSLKKRIKAGEVLLGGCVTEFCGGAVVEAYQEAQFDFVMLDREHSRLDRNTLAEQMRAARLLGFSCIIRAADNSYSEIAPLLDQLPDGIFVPRIRSAAEVKNVVDAVKYPPTGKRGCGASTCPAGLYKGWNGGAAEMIKVIDENTVIGIQIETKEALENLDEILAVPGIDVAVVGNDDLSTGMGIPGQFDSERYQEAVIRIIAACRKHGVLPGIAGGAPEFVRKWAKAGMRMFWAASDICLLWHGAAEARKSAALAAEEGIHEK